MKKTCATVSLAMALLLTGHARAALESRDWSQGSNDNWITRDTSTGLDWLDVTLTVNQTFDQTRLGEWYANGFRHATRSEVQQLFVTAGTPDDGFDISVTHPSQTLQLIGLLGATLEVNQSRWGTFGFVGTDFFGQDISDQSHPIGTVFSALLGKLDVIDLSVANLGVIGEAHFTGGHPFSNESDSVYGSFLVRPAVPEPSTYLSLMLGLGLVGWQLRSHRTSK